MTQNANKKSTLAKLLATENIEVQENQVKTASFDVKDRILTLPIFKEEHKSKYVYDMLVGHEVSHALHTPHEEWANVGNRSDEFRSFVNVLEDVRIDQLIQKKYPGLKKGKYLALNVANTKQYKTFEEDTVDLAKEVGYEHTDTWWLSLSTQQGGSAVSTLDGDTTETKQKQQYMGKYTRPDVSGRKFEPTFIFKK